MVYCGKPSYACGPCRSKKTRCDKVRPSCGQCLRTKTKCVGYRDVSDVLFRDQTRSVASRVQALQGNSVVSGAKQPAAPIETREAAITAELNLSVPQSLLSRVNDLGTAAFYEHFVANGMAPNTDTLGLNPEVYRNARRDSPLSELIVALGLVSHPETRSKIDMQRLARGRYARALALTNKSLSDPVARLWDETLMTVLLLAVYELVHAADETTLGAWTTHVNGAINLLLLRGPGQFKRPAGLAMFGHMRTRIFLSCLQRAVPIPAAFLRLSEVAYQYQGEEQRVGSDLAVLCAELYAFNADVVHGLVTNADEIVQRLLEIDESHAAWGRNLPDRYQPKRVSVGTEINNCTYDGYYDSFSSRYMACIRNDGWVTRIMINLYILAHLARTTDYANILLRKERAVTNIRALSSKICASVPFIMGIEIGALGEIDASNLYGFSSLAWHLYPIIKCDFNSSDMRHWCYDRLVKVSELSGMKHAQTLADMGRNKSEICKWVNSQASTTPNFSLTSPTSTSTPTPTPVPITTAAAVPSKPEFLLYQQRQSVPRDSSTSTGNSTGNSTKSPTPTQSAATSIGSSEQNQDLVRDDTDAKVKNHDKGHKDQSCKSHRNTGVGDRAAELVTLAAHQQQQQQFNGFVKGPAALLPKPPVVLGQSK